MGAYSAGGAGPARRFEGRTALISGGSSGIGRATAQRLAAEGASLVLLGHDAGRGQAAAKELAATGASAVFLTLDLRDDNAIASVAAELRDRLDAIHVPVNSAGVVHINGRQVSTFTDGGLAGWDDVIGVNLPGCAAPVHELQPLLIAGAAARSSTCPRKAPSRRAPTTIAREGQVFVGHLEHRCSGLYLAEVVILSFSELNLTRVMNDKEILKITEASAS